MTKAKEHYELARRAGEEYKAILHRHIKLQELINKRKEKKETTKWE